MALVSDWSVVRHRTTVDLQTYPNKLIVGRCHVDCRYKAFVRGCKLASRSSRQYVIQDAYMLMTRDPEKMVGNLDSATRPISIAYCFSTFRFFFFFFSSSPFVPFVPAPYFPVFYLSITVSSIFWKCRSVLTLLITLCNARRVSLLSGKVVGSKYCGAYSSSHSGRTSVTVRMNWWIFSLTRWWLSSTRTFAVVSTNSLYMTHSGVVSRPQERCNRTT